MELFKATTEKQESLYARITQIQADFGEFGDIFPTQEERYNGPLAGALTSLCEMHGIDKAKSESFTKELQKILKGFTANAMHTETANPLDTDDAIELPEAPFIPVKIKRRSNAPRAVHKRSRPDGEEEPNSDYSAPSDVVSEEGGERRKRNAPAAKPTDRMDTSDTATPADGLGPATAPSTSG
jgi:hypothetical protein